MYLLQSQTDKSQSYIGSTAQPVSVREAEHNGQSGGGDVAPEKYRPWALVLSIDGFATLRECRNYEHRACNVFPATVQNIHYMNTHNRFERAVIRFLWHYKLSQHPTLHVRLKGDQVTNEFARSFLDSGLS